MATVGVKGLMKAFFCMAVIKHHSAYVLVCFSLECV